MAAPATPSLARARYRHLGDGYFSGAAAWIDSFGRFACAGLFSDANACSAAFRAPRQASPKNSRRLKERGRPAHRSFFDVGGTPTLLEFSSRFRFFTPARAAALALTLLAAHALLLSQASAATYTWDGSNSGNWDAGPNWVGSSVPTFDATADLIFRLDSTGSTTTNIGSTKTIRSLTFNQNATANFTVSLTNGAGGSALDLTLGNATNAATITVNASAGNGTIGTGFGSSWGSLILGNNLTVDQNSTTGTLMIDRPITESGGTYGITKNGSGTLTLSGNNTYTGTTTLNAGTLRVGNNSTFGTSSVVVNSSSVVIDSAVSTSYTLSNNITLNTQGTIGAGGGNMGNLTFGGIISGTGDLKVDVGTGVISLNGLNTFTGNVVVDRALDANGGLSFNSIANAGVASALGAGSSISLGIFASAPYFVYTGNTAASSNRSIALTGGSATIISRNASLTLSGNVTSFSQSLILQGSAGGGANFNELSGIYSGGGSLSVQSGSGDVWKISGNNTYTGITYSQFSSATIAGHSNAFGSTANGTQVTQNSQILLTGNISVGAEALTLNSGAGGSWNGQNGAALRSYTGNNSWAGAITLGQATTIATNSGAGLTLSGGIGGAFNLVFNSIGDTIASGNITTSTGTLTKSGAGNLTLSGNNTYTGATTISAGMIQIGHASALGVGGNITFGGGGLQYGSGMTVDVSSRLKNSASAILIDTNSNNVTFASALGSTNSAGLTKNGSGTLTLSGANSYTGTTTINAGTLKFQANTFNATSRNYTITSGAVLNLDGANNFAGGNSTISGAGKLLITGGQFQGQATASPTVVGNISLGSGGTIEIASGATLYNGGYTSVFWTSNLADIIVDGTLNVADGRTVIVDALTGSGTIDKTINTGTVTLQVGVDNGTGTFSGIIKNTIGSTALTKNGTGTLTLSGNNTYTGTTTISAGTLTISGGSAIADNGAVTLANATSTALNVNSSETIGNLSGGGSLGGNIAIASGQTLTVNQTSSLSYNGSISGAGGLTINGTNQLQLMGNNSFTGMTTVNSGILRLQGSGSSTTIVGNITVSGGSLNFGANSQIADTASITLTSGTIDLGTRAETIESITMSGGYIRRAGAALTLNSASSFTGGSLEFTAIASRINTTGTTTLGNVTFDLSSASITNSDQLRLGGDIIVNANTTANFTNSGGGMGQLGLNGANRTIDVGTGAAMNVGWSIAGTSVGITKNGSGSLVLSGNSTYTGATTINAGTIQMGHANGLGSGGNITFGGGALQYGSGITTDISSRLKNSGSAILIDTNSNDVTFASAVDSTNTLGLTKNGIGMLALSGNNTYTGATTINAGTLQIGAGGTTGSLSSSSSITNNATLVFNRTDSITQGTHFNSVIAGTGALIQAGSGTVTLSGNNTYSGATTINAGTLAVTGNISSSATTVATGGTLSGTGRVGATTVNAGGILSPNTSETAGTLTTSSLTINGGGYNWTIANGSNFATAGTDYDQITTTGALTLNNTAANPFTVYLYGDATGWNGQVNKTWNIMTAASMTGFNAGNFSINFDNFGIASENRAGTWTFNATSGTNITLSYALQTPNYYWDGASGNWSDSYVPNTRGFNPGPPENDKNIFLTGSGGTVTNNIANGTLTSLGFITFNSTAGAYTLAANAGSSGASGGTALTVLGDVTNNSVNAQTINLAMAFTGSSTGTINAAAGNITIGGVLSGSGALSKTGGNTLVLSASNTYSGGTTLRNGTLAINNATAIGTGALTIVSGTLGNTSGANITLSNNNAQNWNGNFTYNSAKDLNMGTGAVTMNASRTVTVSSSNFTVGGIISGSGYSLTKNGSGTMILSGANTYTGATTINAGTLTANGGSAIANASAVSVGSGAVFNLGASETVGSIAGAGNISLGSFTLTAGGDNSSTTASGVISGTGALTKTGTGALTLSGANTYNGTTTVSAGTLKAGSITGFSSNSALNVASGATLDLAGYNSTILGLSSNTTNGTITNSGSLAQLTISKAFGQNSTAGTTAQLFTGNLSIQLFGGGTTDSLLTNTSNTYSGGTTFGNGSGTTTTRIFTGGGTIGAGSPGAVTSGRYGTGTITLGAAITDRVQFYFDGGATINNAIVVNTAAGTDNSSDIGAFRAETSGIVLAGSINANLADAMFSATNGSGRAISVTGAISGNSGVTVRTSGSGGLNVTLNATANANTYAGNTTINTANSTLTLGKSDQIANGVGKGNLIINSGTFAMGGFSDTINGLSGNGTIDGVSGSSILTVGDNNTTSTFSGVIKNTAGNLALTKNGTGTLTLSGNSTHTGATTVNAGTLTVSGNISSSASTIASGATLDGIGRVGAVTVSGTMAGTLTAGNITVSSGGLLSPGGTGSVGTIAAGNITLSAGSGYAWTLANATGAAGTGFDQVTGTGALTLSNTAASPFTVYVFGNATNWSGNTTSWNIISAASQTGFSSGNFAINVASFGVASANRTGTWSFTNPSGGNITLNYTVAGADSIWAGTTGVWSGNFTPGVSTDKNITFTGAGGTATNDIASGTLSSVNFITFNSTAGAYTLAANAGSSGNGTALTVLGDIVNNSANATGQTISMALALGSTSTGIVNTAAGNITISGVISGAGALTKTGNSTLTLNATNTFTGAVVINAGTLATGSAGLLADTANVTINSGGNYTVGAADTIASISGSGALRLNAALTMNGTNSTFSGNISGASAIVMNTGTLNFSGNNTNWSGGISCISGSGMSYPVFIAGADNAFGNGTIAGGIGADFTLRSSDATDRTLANSISRTNASAGTIVFGSAGTGNLTIQGGFSSQNNNSLGSIQVDNAWTQINGVVASSDPSRTFTKTGNGTLILNGNNTYTLATTISAGTLQIGASGLLGGGSYSGNIAINGLTSAFVYAGTNNQTLTGLISGNGVFTKNGSGMLTINASNTIGAKTVNGGTLRIVAPGTVAGIGASNGTVNLNNGSTLQLGFTGANNNPAFTGGVVNIDSTGGATVANDGLNGLIQFGGWFTINTNGGAQSQLTSLNGGYYNDQGANGGLILNVASGSNATADLLLAVGGSYAITKNGTGKVLVTASPTLRGITINNGVLEFGGSSTPTFSASLAFTNNGTFSYNSTASSTISQNITGTGNLTKSNTSTLTLSGAGTNYSGLTTVDAGTLAISNNMTIGAITGAGNMTLGSGFTLTTNSTTNSTFSGVISSSGALMKNGTSTLTLSGNNTYSGGTTINAGTLEIASTGLLGGGNYSGNIVNNGALLIASNSNQILSGAISGIGALTKNGTGTLTLSGSNSYSGGTTLNTGTLVIGHANAAGTGTITQANGSSLLKIDTTGTITNAMSVYNVLASQSATLSGAITVKNATWDIDTGDTLTISGAISGSGGVTKNGNGTLVLSGNNSYSGASLVNAGTLNAANAGALGSNNTVQVTGGTLLVTADDAINGMTVTLNSTSTTVAGLAFNGTYSGLVDNLTLSKNSIIDLGDGSVSIMFDTFVMSTYTLDIYNWTGTTLWGGGTGNDTDKVYFGDDLSDEALAKIYFHSGAVGGGDSFLGSGYDLGLQQTSWDSGLEGYHIIPVPEPETYATGLLLLLGGAWWMWKRKPKAV